MAYTGKDFSLAMEKIQDTALRIYNRANKANVPNALIVIELLDMDLDSIVGREMDVELEKLMIQYDAELRAMQSFADISENVIESLIRTDLIVYQNKIKDKISLTFNHMEDSIYNLESFVDFDSFTRNNPVISEYFFEINNSVNKKEELFNLINNVYFDSLYYEVKNTFQSFDLKKKEFESSFGRLKTHLPQASIPQVSTIVSGFYNDVVLADNNIIIGLDYFLIEESKFKPQDIPSFILNRFNPDNLVPITMSVYCSQFNKINPLDNTMISEMLNFGKLYYLLQAILPCEGPHKLIGYSKEEW